MARNSEWIQTYTGKQFHFDDIHPGDIDLETVAHVLSNLCRYGGHCREFYSVAEHSVNVSLAAEAAEAGTTCRSSLQEVALQGLLHDATEAYCVDVPKPLKRMLRDYDAIEQRIWLAVAKHFGVPHDLFEAVRHADHTVLLAEQRVLMPDVGPDWFPEGVGLEPADVRIACWGPTEAKRRFMHRFMGLMK